MNVTPQEIADRFVSSVWNEGEIELLDELVEPDVESRLNAEVLQGRGALKDFVWQFHRAFPDLLVEVDSTVVDETAVAQGLRMRGTHEGPLLEIEATGRPVSFTATHILHLGENGTVNRYWGNFDALGLLQQLGVLGNEPEES